ncbi:hypothetical protein LWI29_029785 [Acer saccharum]|uniref:Uncharacterized protein n=1 Tax=Acer saccharum TaxID=4024 RepID=A0AA39SNS3_ACESA|nr:hypothetical protein LWI29_029785 [Acer saccharum]
MLLHRRRCTSSVAVAVVATPSADLGSKLSWLAELGDLDEVAIFDWLRCNTQHVLNVAPAYGELCSNFSREGCSFWSDCKADALSGQIAKLTSERDNALSECKSLREELTRVKEDYHKVVIARDGANKGLQEASNKIVVLERDLAKYTENLAKIMQEIEIRAVDLFKQSPAFNALTFAHFVKGVEACWDFLHRCGEVKAAGEVDAALNLAIRDGNKKLKAQVDKWCTDCKSKGLPILPMHVDLSADPRTTYGSPQPDSPWLDPIPDLGPADSDDEEDEDKDEDEEEESECDES